jgi:hypothetical protein
MTTPRRPISVLLVIVAILAAACGWQPPAGASTALGTASPPPSTAPSGPLLTVETQGGECMQGACGGTIAIEADGRVHVTDPKPAELGTLSSVALEGLVTEIGAADFEAIRSRPFTETCPIAYDGQQIVYTFTTPSGPIRVDSCEVVVDPAHPLFVAVDAALAAAAFP